MKSVASHNRKIIAHIQKSPFFDDYLMGANIIQNEDFLDYMEEVEDNPYIINLHLDIAERLVTSGRMQRRVKSEGDWLDIFYEAGIPLRNEKGRHIKVHFVEKTPISCGGGYFCCI